jgi:hypothetical protein
MVVAVVGFGGSLATVGTLARISTPTERGELFAVGYLIAYLTCRLPAVAAGLPTAATGLRPITIVYAIAIIVLGMPALVAQRRPDRGKPLATASHSVDPCVHILKTRAGGRPSA